MRKGLLLLGMILLLSVFVFSEDMTILLAPKSLNNPYWFAVENGMKDAAEKLGIKAIFDAPVEADAAKQAEKILSYIVKGVDGIGISPNDPEGIKVVVKRALDKGIPVIMFDSDSPDSGRYAYIGTNNYNAGYEAGKLMAQLIEKYKAEKKTIRLAILTGGLAALNLNERIRGFKDALEDYSKRSGKEIVYVADPFPCDDDSAKAIQIIRDVTRKYTDLDGWFMSGGWPLFAPKETVISALGGPERMKDLLVVGFDTLLPELELVKAGAVKGLVGQRPYDMGYLSVLVLYNMAKIGVENTLKMLPKVVKEDGTVDYIIDTGVDIVTEENVDQFYEYAKKIYSKR
ncbi:LacI family transcriptional regulator [Thermotoga maritima MSB8]|uniref:XylE2 n=1 Tax=Thermotoga maritima (strain ATCC 43589 / DSM 3109 / JCM 10099 / NBRC 100826 / MSB8) TaxID=243274 RepID=G4FGN5_THEMA|nr:sugar-binding protein [Thermotoga maritima]AEP25084.1 XylE2 [Thermotoga maritima MSB8]AGL50782.1 putative beta-xyloside ABC transporter, substrate-binding component [Thermotoga maritima MSB8]AHD18260.1 LacI family transcriptional regulator [Thermotoga maritima MSB8]AKE27724.1 LacI family transcriptional regulator [Thermotoga maritima]AKE29599.1 LacI family transcriptional regulator [Thermotoga maritima MSB8]